MPVASSSPCGTAIASSVSADPPNARRSMSTIWCSVAPSFSATRCAAASSTACRWPYRKLSAWAWYPSWIAIASTVAESSPPLSSTTAFATPTPYSIHKRAGRALRSHLVGQDGAVGRARDALRRDFPRALAADAHAMLRRLDKTARVHPNNYEAVINALAARMGGSSRAAARPAVILGLDPGAAAVDRRVAATYDDQVRRGLF